MREPGFWRHDGLLAHLLQPAAGLYAHAARRLTGSIRAETVPVPVFCIGGATVGGSGKTPVAQAVARLLRDADRRPHLLLRGYGGSLRGPVRVDPAVHDASTVGDEALLHAADGPTWIAQRRAAGARAAIAAGAGCIVLDDGLQHRGLAWTRSLLVVDGAYGTGNGRTLPAGPLREPWDAALAKADAVVLIGPDRVGMAGRLGGRPLIRAEIETCGDTGDLAGRRVVAFAGIARPERFRRTLGGLGTDVARFVAFADHHAYRQRELARLHALAGREQALLVTTAKDAMRIPPGWRARLRVLGVRLAWQDAPWVAQWLAAS